MKHYLKFDGKEFYEVPATEEDTLRLLQKEVDGYIELVYFPELEKHRIDAFVNAEGKLTSLPFSLAITAGPNLVDLIAGPILFARNDEEGNTLPLEPGDDEIIKNMISKDYYHISINPKEFRNLRIVDLGEEND